MVAFYFCGDGSGPGHKVHVPCTTFTDLLAIIFSEKA